MAKHFNGDKLRELREADGLTQAQLGDVFGVTNLTVHNWEAEKKAPSFDTVVRLSEYFVVSIACFVK